MNKKIFALILFIFIIAGCTTINKITGKVSDYFENPIKVDSIAIEKYEECWRTGIQFEHLDKTCAIVKINLINTGEKAAIVSSTSKVDIISAHKIYNPLDIYDHTITFDRDICRNTQILHQELKPEEKISRELCFLNLEWLDDENAILKFSINKELREVRLQDYLV